MREVERLVDAFRDAVANVARACSDPKCLGCRATEAAEDAARAALVAAYERLEELAAQERKYAALYHEAQRIERGETASYIAKILDDDAVTRPTTEGA